MNNSWILYIILYLRWTNPYERVSPMRKSVCVCLFCTWTIPNGELDSSGNPDLDETEGGKGRLCVCVCLLNSKELWGDWRLKIWADIHPIFFSNDEWKMIFPSSSMSTILNIVHIKASSVFEFSMCSASVTTMVQWNFDIVNSQGRHDFSCL